MLPLQSVCRGNSDLFFVLVSVQQCVPTLLKPLFFWLSLHVRTSVQICMCVVILSAASNFSSPAFSLRCSLKIPPCCPGQLEHWWQREHNRAQRRLKLTINNLKTCHKCCTVHFPCTRSLLVKRVRCITSNIQVLKHLSCTPHKGRAPVSSDKHFHGYRQFWVQLNMTA